MLSVIKRVDEQLFYLVKCLFQSLNIVMRDEQLSMTLGLMVLLKHSFEQVGHLFLSSVYGSNRKECISQVENNCCK